MTPAERDLFAAIGDMLNVPPSAGTADDRLADKLLRDRANAVRAIVATVVGNPDAAEACTKVLREEIQRRPVTYRPYEREARDARPEYVAEGIGVRLRVPRGER